MYLPQIGQFAIGKFNKYQITHILTEKCNQSATTLTWIQLKCVDFVDIEDLGDQILCKAINDEIWIANCHFKHMKLL